MWGQGLGLRWLHWPLPAPERPPRGPPCYPWPPPPLLPSNLLFTLKWFWKIPDMQTPRLGVGEEWGEGGCVAGGSTSILKMLQISTAFPRNHKHAVRLPAALPATPTPWSCRAGGGELHRWGWALATRPGSPLPGPQGCLAPPLSVLGSGYGCAPGFQQHWGRPPCQTAAEKEWGLHGSPPPAVQFAGGGGRGSPAQSPACCLAAASVLLNTGDSVSKAYFFSCWLQFGWETISSDLGPHSGCLSLPP